MARKAYKFGVEWIFLTSGGCIVASVAHYLKKKETKTSLPAKLWDSNWDKRDITSVLKPYKNEKDPKVQKKLEEKKQRLTPTARRHIFLIRHGQYNLKAESEKAKKLTSLGKEQSDLVGQRLRDMKFDYSKLVRSTMVRAIQTSDEILKYFPDIAVEESHLLVEGNPIPSEPPMGRWREEYKYYQDGPRIEAAFRQYFHRAPAEQKKDSYEIIVCHANVIRYFICRLLQVPPEAWLLFSLHHCSITKATIEPNGNVYLSAISDHGFIPVNKLSH